MTPDTNFLSGTARLGPYVTYLPPVDELRFQQWVRANRIPFQDGPNSDYDMRGFWRGLQSGDPRARTAVSPFDGQMHFSDTWKTPYHKSFSAESIYATPNAPSWMGDRLVDKLGNVLVDETPKPSLKDMMRGGK